MTEAGGKLLLEMRGLRIEAVTDAGWQEIVHGVDIELRRGEVLGLIGESGAGKSTIGIAAMGMTRSGCRISGGSIVFDDQDLLGMPESDLKELWGEHIAYVAQSASASFNPARRLMNQLVETPVQHGVLSRAEARNKGVELFRRLRLPNPETIGWRFPHQVSGGQLQRAMTAMAMVCQPSLIIFDEPTTALDVTTQIEVLIAIREIVRKYGTAVIYITHDLAVVSQMADRIMVLRHGNMVEQNTTRKLLKTPAEDYTRQLLAVRSFSKTQRQASPNQRLILQVSHLYAGYDKTDVLRDINFDVPAATTVAVVGESGSGKTTLGQVIAGMLAQRTGSVKVDGQEFPDRFQKRSLQELRRIQMVFQTPDTALNPRQKIGDIIGRPVALYSGRNGEAHRERVNGLLQMIELDPAVYYNRFPGELSGGQKQRVCIARALAAEPDLIICDEVTSALDQLVAEEILKLLDRLQRELGLSYLFITHDLATVRAIADTVLVMSKGEIVEQGSCNEVFLPPHHPYTQQLLQSVPQMDPDWLSGVIADKVVRHEEIRS